MSNDTTPVSAPAAESEQEIAARNDNRSHRPDSEAFKAFITSGWAPRASSDVEAGAAAPYTAAPRTSRRGWRRCATEHGQAVRRGPGCTPAPF